VSDGGAPVPFRDIIPTGRQNSSAPATRGDARFDKALRGYGSFVTVG
jgi:hypothetical protein